MTLANRAGQITGIDEKEGVRRLLNLQDYENTDEIIEEMYPPKEYDMNRAHQVLAAPIGKPTPLPAGTPELRAQPSTSQDQPQNTGQGLKEAIARLERARKIYESNGHAANHR